MSKKDTFRDVGWSVGAVSLVLWSSWGGRHSLLPLGNVQFSSISDSAAMVTAIGAGLGALFRSLNLGSMHIPMSRTRSSSEPHCAILPRTPFRDVVRSILSVVEPSFHFAFLTPRSRTKEPSTKALATAVARRISMDAQRERYCWEPFFSMMFGIRYDEMMMGMRLREKRRTKCAFR